MLRKICNIVYNLVKDATFCHATKTATLSMRISDLVLSIKMVDFIDNTIDITQNSHYNNTCDQQHTHAAFNCCVRLTSLIGEERNKSQQTPTMLDNVATEGCIRLTKA